MSRNPIRCHHFRARLGRNREELNILRGEKPRDIVKREPVVRISGVWRCAGRIERESEPAILTVSQQDDRFAPGATCEKVASRQIDGFVDAGAASVTE